MKVSQMLISVLIKKEIVNEGVELEKDGLAGNRASEFLTSTPQITRNS